jgi:hypothetical protein
MKDLCKAMGIEVKVEVKCSLAGKRSGCLYLFSEDVTCCGSLGTRKCEHAKGVAMPGPDPTDPAFCWRALQYMMGRGDWVLFDNHAYGIWWKAEHEMDSALYIKWLLSDPARFIELADEWCREHTEKGE